MELFIPSLIVLVLGAIFLFAVLPKLSPYVLGGLAVSMFGLGLWQHYTMFPYEYKMSVASDTIKQYSGFIMLLAVIFAGVVGVLMMHGGNPPSTEGLIPAMPAMPNIMGSSNNAKNGNNAGSIFNLGGNNAKNGNSGGIMGTVANAFKPANNAKKNNNLASPSFKTV
jgi:hypothetical protein